MIGAFRVYGNYWSSPVRSYLEANKIPSELVGDWVVIEYKEKEQIPPIISKVLEVNYAKARFSNIDGRLGLARVEDIKNAQSEFKNKNYSENFIRGAAYLSRVVLEETHTKAKERIERRLGLKRISVTGD